jgi:hypothetical protein
MSRVFILGAGASRFAGYPLAPDLWPFVRERAARHSIAKEGAEAVIEAMERILRVLPAAEQERPNLEEVFACLDLAELGTNFLSIEKVDWSLLRLKVIGMINWALLLHQDRLRDRSEHGNRVALVLKRWTDELRPGETIISFNWDILHETAFWQANKWHYADGYGFRCVEASANIRSPIRMLKLHGSVNWAQRDEDDCEPSIEHRDTFFPGANDRPGSNLKSAGQWNEGRYLIIPSYLKNVSTNRLLLKLWNQASDALVAASEVIVIGFQLHRADALARQLLAAALLRNEREFSIRVVSPPGSTDQWDDFCYGIGRGLRRVRRTFEEWVLDR